MEKLAHSREGLAMVPMVAVDTIDLEEAVGSYLNCLSTSCAAGSRLYTSVSQLIHEKFERIFSSDPADAKSVRNHIQALETQNAFEGYQDALLECKTKLLEILVESHNNKKHGQDGRSHNSSQEDYASVAVRVAKELYCYHQTFADVLKPLLYSEFPADLDNAVFSNMENKEQIIAAWSTLLEVNRPLRVGYGLSNQELALILAWQHGEDLSESSRKKLNGRIDSMIQQYCEKLVNSSVFDLHIPAAFNAIADELPDLLRECCTRREAVAASCQQPLLVKEDIELMLHRELPRVALSLNGVLYERALPGKAFENTTQKMRAVRELIAAIVEVESVDVAKERLDLFCLRMLASSCLSVADVAARTATVMAYGKADLVQVKPLEDEKVVYVEVRDKVISIEVPSRWGISEDNLLFAPLCRGTDSTILAVVDAFYQLEVNVLEYLTKSVEPLAVVHIANCTLLASVNVSTSKPREAIRERSKSIKNRLSKATMKLFHLKSLSKNHDEANQHDHSIGRSALSSAAPLADDELLDSSTDDSGVSQPVPPPRPKRKARKSRKIKADDPSKKFVEASKKEEEERRKRAARKEDTSWFSSSTHFGIPSVPTLTGSHDLSPSVASFEELQGVIDFLSASSSSSLCISEKTSDKPDKQVIKKSSSLRSHKRRNSVTSLQNEPTASDSADGGSKKELLSRKRSASFSGKTEDSTATGVCLAGEDKDSEFQARETLAPQDSSSSKSSSSLEECARVGSCDTDKECNSRLKERTPGDGMDHKSVKTHSSSVSCVAPIPVPAQITVADCIKTDVQSAVADSSSLVVSTSTGAESLPSCTDSIAASVVMGPGSELAPSGPLSLDAELASVSGAAVAAHRVSAPVANDWNNNKSLEAGRSSPTLPVDAYVKRYASSSFSDTSESEVASTELPSHVLAEDTYPNTVDHPVAERERAGHFGTYEPFSSSFSWSSDFGEKMPSLWRDNRSEQDKIVSPRLPVWSHEGDKSDETEFTIDKQRDLQTLLEGSNFMHPQRNGQLHENWKDRIYAHQALNTGISSPSPVLKSSTGTESLQRPYTADPWPLHRSVQSQPAKYGASVGMVGSSSFRTLLPQGPPPSHGPYMRQNREQLLAKRLILEQQARMAHQASIDSQPKLADGLWREMQGESYQSRFGPLHAHSKPLIHRPPLTMNSLGFGDIMQPRNESLPYEIPADVYRQHRPVSGQFGGSSSGMMLDPSSQSYSRISVDLTSGYEALSGRPDASRRDTSVDRPFLPHWR